MGRLDYALKTRGGGAMNRNAGQHEIWKLIQGVFDAFEGRDVQGMENILHKDSTLWDLFEPELITGKEEREAFHERDKGQSMARGRLSISIEPLKLDVFNEVAVARYWLNFNYEPPNATAGRRSHHRRAVAHPQRLAHRASPRRNGAHRRSAHQRVTPRRACAYIIVGARPASRAGGEIGWFTTFHDAPCWADWEAWGWA